VVIESRSRIKTTTGALIDIQGTAGKTLGSGVQIGTWNEEDSSVEAPNGDIRITGAGSITGITDFNFGTVFFNSYISTGNRGYISITGTGGYSSGSYNFGVVSNNSLLRAYDGSISLNGYGGGGGGKPIKGS
jgi:hypothetical protein